MSSFTVPLIAILLIRSIAQSHAYPGVYGSICEPGYGDDCLPSGKGKPNADKQPAAFRTDADEQLASAGSITAPPLAVDSFTPDCTVKVPEDCKFPFVYKGISYQSCTEVDAVGSTWCSTDSDFAGHWRQCTEPCKSLAMHGIVTGVVASGVAAAGIGLIAAATVHAEKNKQSTTTIASAKPVLSAAAVAPAANTASDSAMASATVPPTVASRFLEKQTPPPSQQRALPQASPFRGLESSVLMCFGLGLCMVCGFAALFSALVLQHGRTRKNSEEPTDELLPINEHSGDSSLSGVSRE